jgi:hypothetical protein
MREAPTRVIQVELATNETIGFDYSFWGELVEYSFTTKMISSSLHLTRKKYSKTIQSSIAIN